MVLEQIRRNFPNTFLFMIKNTYFPIKFSLFFLFFTAIFIIFCSIRTNSICNFFTSDVFRFRWAGSELFVTSRQEDEKSNVCAEDYEKSQTAKMLQRYTADYSR